MNGRLHRQRGMSILVAVFLIVVVASLAAFAVTAGTARRASANLGLQADRALAAARAGTEWAAYRALGQSQCAQGGTLQAGTVTNFALTQGALNGFKVRVTVLARTDHTVSGVQYFVCDVESFAQWSNFGAADYASRTITARFSNF
jgi:MSHA biogenesis protein MshP